MTILPIEKKLKKKVHKTIALVQDILVMEIYNSFPNVIIHGGTAIWRCYGGNRFSEDIDVYLPTATKKKGTESFLNDIKNKGFVVEKFKETENSIFSKFTYLGVTVSFEAIFKNIRSFVARKFEMSDGTFIFVNTLTPEEMIMEKVAAYLERRKIRDLYDMFFLLEFVEDRNKIKNAFGELLKKFGKPKDKGDLKALVISGSIPDIKTMLERVERWAKSNI